MGRPDPSPGKDWLGEKTDHYTGYQQWAVQAHDNSKSNLRRFKGSSD